MAALVRLALLLVLAAAGLSAPASSEERRVALVIGNAAYRHGVPLRNPVNDAQAVAEALRSIGFDVGPGPLIDADKPAMEAALRAFRDRSRNAGTAFFHYAGHGIQADQRNFLVPVDAVLEDPADIDLEAVDVNAVLGQMRAEINLIVLDACRDNPFQEQLQAASASLGRSWSGGRGFARIDPGTMRGGSLLAMAAAPGATAADGGDSHSPYTAALLRHLTTPGLEARLLFAKVREEVEAATGRAQRPEAVDRLPARQVFLITPPGVQVQPPAAPSDAVELAFWNAIVNSRDPADFEAYLQRFPDGTFAGLARNRLRGPPPPPAAAPASVPPPPPPPARAKPEIWVGTGHQFDNDHRWTIRVTLTQSLGKQAIAYPSLNCGGDLQPLPSTGRTRRFREILTFGKERCIDGGTVVLTPQRGQLLYEWHFPGNTAVGARGTLKPAGG